MNNGIRGVVFFAIALVACGEIDDRDRASILNLEAAAFGGAGGGCNPAGVRLEVEALQVTGVGAATFNSEFDLHYSQQRGIALESHEPFDYIQFKLRGLSIDCLEGWTRIGLGVKQTPSSGRLRLLTNTTGGFTQTGAVQDLYAAQDTYTELYIGAISLPNADTLFRFQVGPKNVLSNDYLIDLDYIDLSP